MKAPDHVVVELIRQGLGTRAIREQTRADYNRIARLRRENKLPVPKQQQPTRTITETLALYTEAYGDGHLRWTGPIRGRTPMLCAEGERYNARVITFRLRWRREPDGYVRTACTEPGCIAGEHLIDDRARDTPHECPIPEAITRLARAGVSDWEIVRRLNTSTHTIVRIRR
ncbi:hypothetical protein ACFWB4_42905, partial [Streptomyces sp. NPDC060001]